MLDQVMKFVFDNIWLIVGFGIVIYFIHEYFSFKRRTSFKTINRSEIERKEFIDRMKYNISPYKWLYKGKEVIGKISNYTEELTKGNPKDLKTISLVFRPMLIKRPIKISNPFAKMQPLKIEKNNEIIVQVDKDLVLNETIELSKYSGFYYSIGKNEPIICENIRNLETFKTDLNSVASIYFVKSQEQSTFDPNMAHDVVMKEKELQVELAKRKGKTETI